MPLSPTVIVSLIELGKLGLQSYFQAMRITGKTKEEIDRIYGQASVDFDLNHPDSWDDVSPDDVVGGSGSYP